jgi:hypothetical protein
MWLGAGAIAIFIGTLLAGMLIRPGDPHDSGKVGLDFIAFYTAGTFVREGKSADLYDVGKVQAFQHELARQNGVELGSAVGPWWNPPFYAWVFLPIAKYSYFDALKYWELINLACAALAAGVLCFWVARAARSCLPAPASFSPVTCADEDTGGPPVPLHGWKSWLLVPMLMVLSTPFIHALSHAQNACMSLLLVTVVVVLWRQQRAVAAGLVAGLLFYKPQLGAVLAAVLVLSLGRRALIGLAITAALLLVASLLLPGCGPFVPLRDFLHQMPLNLHFVQCKVRYMWDRHVTFKACFRLLLQGFDAAETTLLVNLLAAGCSGLVGAALLWAVVCAKKAGAWKGTVQQGSDTASAARRDRVIAAAIASTPLLMPFYFDYDQLLLAIPAVLFAVDLIGRDRKLPLPLTDRWLLRIWPVQYAWMMLNADVAVATHVNIGVVLLVGVCGLLIARAGRDRMALVGSAEGFPILRPALRAA